ncbi:MAG: hypothetical protein U0746_15490 [Gemmataceae bacterium]
MKATPSPADDVDKLLAEFYRSEMPNPWPRWTNPSHRVTPAVRTERATLSHGRTVLAAATLALVAGVWVLTSFRPTVPARDGGLNDGTATRPAHWRLAGEEPVKKATAPR